MYPNTPASLWPAGAPEPPGSRSWPLPAERSSTCCWMIEQHKHTFSFNLQDAEMMRLPDQIRSEGVNFLLLTRPLALLFAPYSYLCCLFKDFFDFPLNLYTRWRLLVLTGFTHTFPDSCSISIHWTCSSSDSAANTMVPYRSHTHTSSTVRHKELTGLLPGAVMVLTVKSSRLTMMAKGMPAVSLAVTTQPPSGMTP